MPSANTLVRWVNESAFVPSTADSTLPHLWPTGSSRVSPSTTARYFSSCPSDPTSRWTPCPPKYSKQWLQVRLGCIQLSPSCPFGRLHTFCFLRPARNYPRFWIWRPSFERQRDFNPPEQRAAQRAVRISPVIKDKPGLDPPSFVSDAGYGVFRQLSGYDSCVAPIPWHIQN